MQVAEKEVVEIEPRMATRAELERVHSSQYLDEVLNEYRTSQWSGPRPDLAELAAIFAGGTLTALDLLLRGITSTAIHFPGAKHHAQYDHSSGFCIFADFALAAEIATSDFGKRVAILDIDAHHGDGTENLTADNPNVMTFSIHEKGIFPGTGNEDQVSKEVFNFPLPAIGADGELGKGDVALTYGVNLFLQRAQEFMPDLIFIACGADGHQEDPLSSLQYSVEGYRLVAEQIRRVYPGMPILMGGAGGYLPDSRTPEVWSAFAQAIGTNPRSGVR
jgi:acetoin utilization protein AcuC